MGIERACRSSRSVCAFSVIVSCLLTGGCVSSLPTLSHAHIGHALTAWHDTPDQQGLFVVAELEARNALDELAVAKRFLHAPPIAKIHVGNIIRSLSPDANPQATGLGSGLGYGAIQALQNTVAHLQFAATTPDASANVIWSTENLVEQAKAVEEQLLFTLAIARNTLDVDDSELFDYHLTELEQALHHSVDGADIDNDGVISRQPEESGLAQLRDQLSTMLADEVDPRYRPISQDILFGVVRLPNGDWAYRFDQTS